VFAKYFSYKNANRLLFLLIVVINIYVLLLPLLPNVQLLFKKRALAGVHGLPYVTSQAGQESTNANRKEAPKDNRLVIGGIALDEKIYSGTDASLVNKGVWARPNTSTPAKGSNTVLVAHRFTYNGPATFYNLDKMQTNDTISVYWEGKEYVYAVFEVRVVPAGTLSVEAPTNEHILTLYTCTPLWSARDRLVIKARLANGEAS
jgi:sortase A